MDLFALYSLSVATSAIALNTNHRLIEERLKEEKHIEKNEKFTNSEKAKKLIIVLIPVLNLLFAMKEISLSENTYRKIKKNITAKQVKVEQEEQKNKEIKEDQRKEIEKYQQLKNKIYELKDDKEDENKNKTK